MLPDCPQFGKQHSHILPVQETILASFAMYHYMQGGVGGGKSVGFAVKCCWLSLTIPKNRGVIARHNLDDLYDSSWRKVNDCLSQLAERNIIPNPTYERKVQGEYTMITLHNGSELRAIHGKNWRRGLGSDHGWFWVDDALECLEEFFIGTNVSAGLLSRLRLPHIRFDQSVYNKTNRSHGYLHGMVSSNPPPYNHWLHKLFGDKPGMYTIGDDTVQWTKGDTSDNPFTGASYAKSLIGIQQKLHKDPNNIRRIIHGDSTPAYKGIPVFPQFDHAIHVAPLKYRPELPLIVSYDFGFHHPAVVVSHIYKCEYRTNHYLTLSEVAECYASTIYDFYDHHVKPHIDALYKESKLILNCGDRSGYRSAPNRKDGRSDMKILMYEYSLPFKWGTFDLANSLQYMRGLLSPKQPCKCGMATVLVSNKCPYLIGALEGGYHYPESRTKLTADKPSEDKNFADVACAWRYGAENYVKFDIPWEAQKILRQHEQQAERQRIIAVKASTSHGWMDDTLIPATLLTDC